MLTPEMEQNVPTRVKGKFMDALIVRADHRNFFCDFFKVLLDPNAVPHYMVIVESDDQTKNEITFRQTFGIWRPTSNHPGISADLSFQLSSQIAKLELSK